MINPLRPVIGAAKTMESSLQRFGKRIRKNVAQDQADLKSGKIGRYQRTNPFRK